MGLFHKKKKEQKEEAQYIMSHEALVMLLKPLLQELYDHGICDGYGRGYTPMSESFWGYLPIYVGKMCGLQGVSSKTERIPLSQYHDNLAHYFGYSDYQTFFEAENEFINPPFGNIYYNVWEARNRFYAKLLKDKFADPSYVEKMAQAYMEDGLPTNYARYLEQNNIDQYCAKFLGFPTLDQYRDYARKFSKLILRADQNYYEAGLDDGGEQQINAQCLKVLKDFHDAWISGMDSTIRTPEGIANEKRIWGAVIQNIFTKGCRFGYPVCIQDYAQSLEPSALFPTRHAIEFREYRPSEDLSVYVSRIEELEKTCLECYEKGAQTGRINSYYQSWLDYHQKEPLQKENESEETRD